MSDAKIPDQEKIGNCSKTFDLYNLIIEENRHLHQVWIDNFKIILTFNSILLAGAFAVLAILNKSELLESTGLAFSWSLRVISIIGTMVTLVGVHIIRRTKAITSLRLKEMRHLEAILFQFGMAVFPFEEGALVLGTTKGESFLKDRKNPPYPVKAMKLNPFSGLGGYLLIGASFIVSYIVIFVLSLL